MRLDNCKFAPPSFTTVNFTWAGFPFSCNLSQLLPTYFLLATFFKTTASHITSYNLLYQIVHFSCMETCVQTFISRLLAPCFNACSLMFHVLHLFSQSLQSLISRPTISHGFHWQLSSRTTFIKAMTLQQRFCPAVTLSYCDLSLTQNLPTCDIHPTVEVWHCMHL